MCTTLQELPPILGDENSAYIQQFRMENKRISAALFAVFIRGNEINTCHTILVMKNKLQRVRG
jgi:hypothetical protein